MNTFAKGDAFENDVFSILSSEIKNGNLGISPKSARIYSKKGYYSKDREKDIIMDVSIEIWLPNAEQYSMLWVCECKNYEHRVPVDDVEEFKSKLDQIAGKNVKGVIATRNSFQSGALTYAKNNGIGLVRIMPDDQVEWLMHMMPSDIIKPKQLNSREFNKALVSQDFTAHERSFYSIYDEYVFGDWLSLVKYSLKSDT